MGRRSQCKRGPSPAISFGGPGTDARERCVVSAGPPDKWKLTACDATAPATTCEAWDGCARGAKVTFCAVAADKQPVGGHVLYFNDTKLSLAAAAWELLEAR